MITLFQLLAGACVLGLIVRVFSGGGRRRSETITGKPGSYLLRSPDHRVEGLLLTSSFLLMGLGIGADRGNNWASREGVTLVVFITIFLIIGVVTYAGSRRDLAQMDRQGIERRRLFWTWSIPWKDVSSVTYSEWFGRKVVLKTVSGRKLRISLAWDGIMGFLLLIAEVLPPGVVDARVTDIAAGPK